MFTRFTFGDFIKDKQSVTVAECLLRKWISVFGKWGLYTVMEVENLTVRS